mmetsp:Transcript_87972/g.172084  ORF Transcript_87972/g.172084 Transcript_87972/m.172084 type:complete len:412 (-) Transcript_87972:164-1399(-)
MIKPSVRSNRTFNPIRHIVDNLKPPSDHPKKLLNLALGDPTVHGNLTVPSVVTEAIQDLLVSNTANGYLPSVGLGAARKSVAQYSSVEGFPVDENDVILASGCSGAIELVLGALVDEGDNILVPKPGFPLYQVITQSLGGSVKQYPLKPEESWNCDVEAMDSMVDSKTKAIVISNPSNPCGSNFSVDHLKAIAAVARKHNLLIIADEIYSDLVYSGKFNPMHVYSEDVPVISVGGIAKAFVVPGWRVGWLVIHDKGTGRLNDLSVGIRNLTQLILGANSLIQGTLPRILCPTPGSADDVALKAFNARYVDVLRENAQVIKTSLEGFSALSPVEPQGAMYAMVGINMDHFDPVDISDDAIFASKLLQEENLFVLPGKCFNSDNYVRLVMCCPREMIQDACDRLKAFCSRHSR